MKNLDFELQDQFAGRSLGGGLVEVDLLSKTWECGIVGLMVHTFAIFRLSQLKEVVIRENKDFSNEP